MPDPTQPEAGPESQHGDPFDSLLSLESQYHTEGYGLGYADGSRAGRIEGRVFGLEKGFEKFLELGRLNGRADVWQARLPDQSKAKEDAANVDKLPMLSGTDRLRKHVRRLGELSNVDEVSTENSEDAVQDFEERIRDAKAKAVLISRIVGETDDGAAGAPSTEGDSSSSKTIRLNKQQGAGKSDEMEDFGGLPRAARK